MYTLRYADNVEPFSNPIDLLDKIKGLEESTNFDNQFIVVEKDGNGFIEIALGMEAESLIFYTPESEDENCKISCNKSIARAKGEAVNITSLEGEDLVFSKSNTVPLEETYKVVGAYLEGADFMNIVDWYSY